MKVKVKRIIISICIICACISTSHAQVRIVNSAANTGLSNSPAFIDASSNMIVNASSNVGKGLVFPQVDLSAMNAFPSVSAGTPTSFPTRFDGMIVYNIAESGTAGVGNTEGTLTPGFWYYENKSASNTGGTWKPLSSSTPTYTGSNSITLNNNSIERAALTGDVTAPANSNQTAIAPNAVTTDKIANGAVTAAKLASGAANDADYIIGNEITNVTSGGGLTRSGSGTASDPYTVGISSGGITSNMILNNTITATAIANATITAAKMAPGAVNDADYIVGNEITNVISGGGLVRNGSGTASSPYSVGIQTGGVTGTMINAMNARGGQLMQYDGSKWSLGPTFKTWTGTNAAAVSAGTTVRSYEPMLHGGAMCHAFPEDGIEIVLTGGGWIDLKTKVTTPSNFVYRIACLFY